MHANKPTWFLMVLLACVIDGGLNAGQAQTEQCKVNETVKNVVHKLRIVEGEMGAGTYKVVCKNDQPADHIKVKPGEFVSFYNGLGQAAFLQFQKKDNPGVMIPLFGTSNNNFILDAGKTKVFCVQEGIADSDHEYFVFGMTHSDPGPTIKVKP